MKRREAVNLLYKIYNACQDITINAIQIDTINKENTYPDQDFVLLIKGKLSSSSHTILKVIAKNHNLEVSKRDGITIISNKSS
ncbi:hypothetical protein JJE00_00055 [Candidatus Bathyarchaeota archaeon]|nr:hypothetical protein [Candidatus Bathyarchaeota archaeon]MCJ7713259.1 hypothetical protein [Candidatus Bathyarchaeota archaeon]